MTDHDQAQGDGIKLALISQGDPSVGGIDRYSQNLIRQAAQQEGLEVFPLRVTARRHDDSAPLGQDQEERIEPSKLPVLARSAALFRIRSRPYDVIHFASHLTTPVFAAMKPHIVMTVHGVEQFILPVEEQFTRTSRRDRHWTFAPIRFMHNRIDALITVSYATKAAIVKHLHVPEDKVHVIYNGIDHSVFRPQARGTQAEIDLARLFGIDGPYVLHISHSQPAKNLPRILEAFAIATERDGLSKYTLLIVGPRGRDHAASAARASLKSRVRYLGSVDDDETLAKLYSFADAFLFPSLHESFGLPVLESMACGTPVVSSGVGGIPEVTAGACELVDPRDVGQIAEALQRLLLDADLAAKLSERGLQRARDFTWERSFQEHLDVYRSCVDRV